MFINCLMCAPSSQLGHPMSLELQPSDLSAMVLAQWATSVTLKVIVSVTLRTNALTLSSRIWNPANKFNRKNKVELAIIYERIPVPLISETVGLPGPVMFCYGPRLKPSFFLHHYGTILVLQYYVSRRHFFSCSLSPVDLIALYENFLSVLRCFRISIRLKILRIRDTWTQATYVIISITGGCVKVKLTV